MSKETNGLRARWRNSTPTDRVLTLFGLFCTFILAAGIVFVVAYISVLSIREFRFNKLKHINHITEKDYYRELLTEYDLSETEFPYDFSYIYKSPDQSFDVKKGQSKLLTIIHNVSSENTITIPLAFSILENASVIENDQVWKEEPQPIVKSNCDDKVEVVWGHKTTIEKDKAHLPHYGLTLRLVVTRSKPDKHLCILQIPKTLVEISEHAGGSSYTPEGTVYNVTYRDEYITPLTIYIIAPDLNYDEWLNTRLSMLEKPTK